MNWADAYQRISETLHETRRQHGEIVGDLVRRALKAETALQEWEVNGASVGVTSPGAMQQARHMADAAVRALGLRYQETSPADIEEAIRALRSGERSSPDTAEPAEKQPDSR